MTVGSDEQPLRVAIVGSGPAAFYAAEALLRAPGARAEVDMFERLPFPFGLVRYGVAPDHQKIKSVADRFTDTASLPGFRFFGGVEFGSDITLDDLSRHYHQVLLATGAQTDRRMNIPGEDLPGSYAATEFVAWYNGHPDYRDRTFDLSCERAVVVGVGNVALDVARILSLSDAELWASDVPRHVVEQLAASKVREVVVLGRRGPAQAAFSLPELKELAELECAAVSCIPEEVVLDPRSASEIERDKAASKRVEVLQSYAAAAPSGAERRILLRFLASPVELIAGDDGKVARVRIMKNRLERSESGALAAVATGEEEILDAGLVLRSVGYRGVALPGVPFDERSGTIPTGCGRVLDAPDGTPVAGLYASGWIKRGPSGVVGTNKPDAAESVASMLEDVAAGRTWAPAAASASAALATIAARRPSFVSFDDWRALDAAERAAGAATGRPREKFTCLEDALPSLRQPGEAA